MKENKTKEFTNFMKQDLDIVKDYKNASKELGLLYTCGRCGKINNEDDTNMVLSKLITYECKNGCKPLELTATEALETISNELIDSEHTRMYQEVCYHKNEELQIISKALDKLETLEKRDTPMKEQLGDLIEKYGEELSVLKFEYAHQLHDMVAVEEIKRIEKHIKELQSLLNV
jgi:Lhr-like helicase